MPCTHSFSERQIYRDRQSIEHTNINVQFHYRPVFGSCRISGISAQTQCQTGPTATNHYGRSHIFIYVHHLHLLVWNDKQLYTHSVNLTSQRYLTITQSRTFFYYKTACLPQNSETQNENESRKCKELVWQNHIRDVFVWLHKEWLFLVFCIWVFHLNWTDLAGEYSAA